MLWYQLNTIQSCEHKFKIKLYDHIDETFYKIVIVMMKHDKILIILTEHNKIMLVIRPNTLK